MPTDGERREIARDLIHRYAIGTDGNFTEWQIGMMLAFSDQENTGLRKTADLHNAARQHAEKRELEALAELDEVRAAITSARNLLHYIARMADPKFLWGLHASSQLSAATARLRRIRDLATAALEGKE